MYTDASGNLAQLSVWAGTSSNNGGFAGGPLCRTSDILQVRPLETKSVTTALALNTLTFGTSYGKGSYIFDYADNLQGHSPAGTKMDWPVGKYVSAIASPAQPFTNLYVTWSGETARRYFYVPKGTRYVQIHMDAVASGPSYGVYIRNQNGNLKYFSEPPIHTTYDWQVTGGSSGSGFGNNVDLVVPIGDVDSGTHLPNGQNLDDDQVWCMESAVLNIQGLYFWNVPGYIARSPNELLIPKEAYSNLKPATATTPATSGSNITIRGKVHLYIHADSSGNLPTLSVNNGNQTANWKLFEEKDDVITAMPINGSGGTNLAASSTTNYSLNLNAAFQSASYRRGTAYHLLYDDTRNSGSTTSSTLSWPTGSKISMSSNSAEPLVFLSTATGGQRSFYVPKGVTSFKITASQVNGNGVLICNNAGTTKLTQVASTSAVTMNVPVVTTGATPEDEKIWTIRSNGAGNTLTVRDMIFQGVPGYLGVDSNQLLIPQWTANEAQNLW